MPTVIGYSCIRPSDSEPVEAVANLLVLAPDWVYVDFHDPFSPDGRPRRATAFRACSRGDVLAVPSLERLADSLTELEAVARLLIDNGIALNVGGAIFDPVNDAMSTCYRPFRLRRRRVLRRN